MPPNPKPPESKPVDQLLQEAASALSQEREALRAEQEAVAFRQAELKAEAARLAAERHKLDETLGKLKTVQQPVQYDAYTFYENYRLEHRIGPHEVWQTDPAKADPNAARETFVLLAEGEEMQVPAAPEVSAALIGADRVPAKAVPDTQPEPAPPAEPSQPEAPFTEPAAVAPESAPSKSEPQRESVPERKGKSAFNAEEYYENVLDSVPADLHRSGRPSKQEREAIGKVRRFGKEVLRELEESGLHKALKGLPYEKRYRTYAADELSVRARLVMKTTSLDAFEQPSYYALSPKQRKELHRVILNQIARELETPKLKAGGVVGEHLAAYLNKGAEPASPAAPPKTPEGLPAEVPAAPEPDGSATDATDQRPEPEEATDQSEAESREQTLETMRRGFVDSLYAARSRLTEAPAEQKIVDKQSQKLIAAEVTRLENHLADAQRNPSHDPQLSSFYGRTPRRRHQALTRRMLGTAVSLLRTTYAEATKRDFPLPFHEIGEKERLEVLRCIAEREGGRFLESEILEQKYGHVREHAARHGRFFRMPHERALNDFADKDDVRLLLPEHTGTLEDLQNAWAGVVRIDRKGHHKTQPRGRGTGNPQMVVRITKPKTLGQDLFKSPDNPRVIPERAWQRMLEDPGYREAWMRHL